ncbi:hypothetical protein F4802DRAFT_601408 [Xylaria palmicola]|nr:hypothetical protein F4802DRAFT_601408 [Xylaria palmicola]
MGTFCSINTASESDEQDKSDEDSPSRHSSRKPARQPEMIASSIRSHPQRGGGWPSRPAADFEFRFQRDMAECPGGTPNVDESRRKEVAANRVLARMRAEDEDVFRNHKIRPEDHFYDVRDVLDGTRLFHAARMLPKGAHLHLHFNSTLLPEVLLGYAKNMPNMFIWSDQRLVDESDFRNCKLEFSLRNLGKVWGDMRAKAVASDDTAMVSKLSAADSLPDGRDKFRAYDELSPNIFSREYKHRRKDKKEEVEEMRYQYFRECWDEEAWGNCDEWLIQKLTFSKEEVHSFFTEADAANFQNELDTQLKPVLPVQTALDGAPCIQFNEQEWQEETKEKISSSGFKRGRDSARRAWRTFNGRTKMMKGLFNYETAFRRYTRKCLEEFVKDNVQYAEIRPNFMQTNQILNDEADTKIDNFGTMKLIVEEYENFMKDVGDMRDDGTIIDDEYHRPTFSGMKVIYCTPRSFSREAVQKALDESIEMKKTWPQYIAGFDLVGEEAFGELHPLRYFEDEFRNFQKRCEGENLDIPFLFHCGETPDDLEGNLETALDLGSKRVGHGYALPEKPAILRQMRSQNVCVETCPISNMVLGLAGTMDQHSVYRLLEEKMHCAVSSDNGTLFRSTLSHDFYEVMAGHRNINLYGWKQLARWSIEHSCMSAEERRRALLEWERRWQDFVDALVGFPNPETQPPSMVQLQEARERTELPRFAKLAKYERQDE